MQIGIIKKSPSKQPLVILPLQQSLLKRIRAAEIEIMQESVQYQLIENEVPKVNTNNVKRNSKYKNQIQVKPLYESQFVLSPLNIYEEEINDFLLKYQENVPVNLIKSFCPTAELLEKSKKGYIPLWFSYKKESSSTLEGLTVFYIDPLSKIKRRVTIIHFSVTDEKNIKPFLIHLINYIWNNIYAEEIRVGIEHIVKEEGKLIVYTPLKNSLQDIGFRWKTLINNEHGKRVLIVGLNNPQIISR